MFKEGDHCIHKLGKSHDQHVLTGFGCNFIQNRCQVCVAFGGVVDCSGFEGKFNPFFIFNIGEEVVEYFCEPGPEHHVYFIEVEVKDCDVFLFHLDFELFINEDHEEDGNTVIGFLCLVH